MWLHPARCQQFWPAAVGQWCGRFLFYRPFVWSEHFLNTAVIEVQFAWLDLKFIQCFSQRSVHLTPEVEGWGSAWSMNRPPEEVVCDTIKSLTCTYSALMNTCISKDVCNIRAKKRRPSQSAAMCKCLSAIQWCSSSRRQISSVHLFKCRT